MEDLKKIMTVAESAAREAGDFIVSRIDTVKQITHKRGITDLVTDVDKKSEEMILSAVKASFPGHSILAEESGRDEKSSSVMWVIDPLDGTTNFAHSLPIFCVSIGVMIEGRVRIGVVYDPNRRELFSAREGEGAYLNGKRIHVSQTEAIRASLISTGFPYDITKKSSNLGKVALMLNAAQAVRRPGSAAIDLCYVACGRFDGYWEEFLSPWDTAAGQLVVKEAGGMVTDFNNGDFDIFGKEVLASNGLIHKEMIELFSSNPPQIPV